MAPIDPRKAMLPSLRHNGATNPSKWQPCSTNLRGNSPSLPEVNDLVGYRYGTWLVTEVNPVADVDLEDDEREQLASLAVAVSDRFRERSLARNRPYNVVLVHKSGPLLVPDEYLDVRQDGTTAVHRRTTVYKSEIFYVLKQPYRVCSCHGEIWPCRDVDGADLAKVDAYRMDLAIASAVPGTCAHCLDGITTRQKSLTFPEPSRLLPGAPGPTFHAGKGECWQAAQDYERRGRLADNPDVARLASCPGIRFIHEHHSLTGDRRLDCTAGPACTGLHGPPGVNKDITCWTQIPLAGNSGAYARPTFDCGYRSGGNACIGGDMSSGGTTLSPIAADLLWEAKHHRRPRDGDD